jgi:hypothetical protein
VPVSCARAWRRQVGYGRGVTQAPQEHQPLIRRILGANYLELSLSRLRVDEEPDVATVVKVSVNEAGQPVEVDGRGVGVVDALFAGLLGRYAVEYTSLRSIDFAGFSVSADFDTKKNKTGLDAVGTVTIDVTNSEGRRFTFSDASRSVTASTARAVLAVVQYFVNSERAFITLYNARKDAISRGRDDLLSRYTAELSEVVESTSYTSVIEGFRKERG